MMRRGTVLRAIWDQLGTERDTVMAAPKSDEWIATSREFTAQTITSVQAEFTKWHHENADRVRNVQRGPIERVPLRFQQQAFQHTTNKPADAFVMIVDYERKREAN
jgi:hypothetical protein